MSGICNAKLLHAHGESECVKSRGHDGDHEGPCHSCNDDPYSDNDTSLEWEQDGEDWTKGVPRLK